MDLLIFSGFLTLASILILVGVFGPRLMLSFAGLLFILLGLVMATETLTQSVVSSYNQTNVVATQNNTAWENLTSALAFQTGTSYNIRQYPVTTSYNRTYNYVSQTLMNRSWQYGLVTSGFGFGLIIFSVI